jgi:hypothetical protein
VVLIAATKTGAFREVHVHEVLTQEQLREMVALAKSSEHVCRSPGQAAVDRDVVNDAVFERVGRAPRSESPERSFTTHAGNGKATGHI